jgi:hypothetical protein
MSEHVVPVDFGVTWDPNTEHGRLVITENGDAQLLLNAGIDSDRRDVLFVWRGASVGRMEPPNDEAVSGHRLYQRGLKDCRIGEVIESELIADLNQRGRFHARHVAGAYDNDHHWVIRLKGSIVEVVAESMQVRRVVTRPRRY